MTDALLSLDAGTTAVKAVLFDPDGGLLCVAERPLTLHTPQPGHVELEPQELWQAVLEVLHETAQQAKTHRVAALAVATQGGSFLAADAAGNPTTPIITWMDSRSQPIVNEWKERGLEAEIRRVSGWSLDPGLPLPMIGWLHSRRPETFQKSVHFLSVNDFLTYRLAGVYSMNPSMAGEMLLADIASGGWSPALCDLAGIRPEQLSPIRPSDAVLGPILPEVSRSTGLAPDTLVINGGQDHTCEALAVGMIAPGTALLACGTAWVINGAAARGDMASVPAGMNLNFHVVPGCWVVSQFLGGLGGTLEWWVNRLWQSPDPHHPVERSRLYSLVDEQLEQTRPGAGGLYFFPLGGSRAGPQTAGVGGFWGLQWEHTRADMTRAVMESAVYELRQSLEQLKAAGLGMDEIWMIGGAARSPLWPSIAASLTGAAVTLTHYPHGPALGAAILAGKAVGIYPDLETGRARFDLKPRRVLPDETWRSTYEEHYERYCRLIRSFDLH